MSLNIPLIRTHIFRISLVHLYFIRPTASWNINALEKFKIYGCSYYGIFNSKSCTILIILYPRIHVVYKGGIWVRILNDVQLAIFRPWALLLHLVRPQLLRNHFFWCRRKEYNQGFQETYTLYTFTRFCTSHGPPNAKKWQKVMFLHSFIFLEPSCKFSSSITDII